MCDTLYRKNKNSIIFGKNSDRSANEPNLVIFNKACDPTSSTLKCTYIEIKEASHTYANILVKPSWIWGAEMGINEHRLVIGNEAVFTKKKNKKPSLLGMDFLRLALERAKNADEAVSVITTLLEEYGQGGNCGYDKLFYYDNSYLIADSNKALILETAGKEYVVKELNDFGNISNRLSIKKDGFNKKHSDFLFTHFSKSKHREETAKTLLKDEVDSEKMVKILQSHATNTKNLFLRGSVGSLCMHQSLLGDHTTGSLVVDIKDSFPTIWITGSSSPCLAIYKPVYFDNPNSPLFIDEKESLKYWLERELLNRAIYSGYVNVDDYQKKIHDIQLEIFNKEKILRKSKASKDDYYEFAVWASELEQTLIDSYQDIIENVRNGNIKMKGLWKKKTKKLLLNQTTFNIKK